jgi:hypothetical protein
MRKTILTLALGTLLTLGTSTARADDLHVVVRHGGHFETRLVTVTEPGHWTTVERRVWVPQTVVYERRERCVPIVTIRGDGCRFTTTRTICETVPVTRGGYWTTTCDRVWVEGCTHTVERRVWVEERCEPRVGVTLRIR